MKLNESLNTTPFSVFESLDKLREQSQVEKTYDLHQGKTTFPPLGNVYDWGPEEFDILPYQHASPSGVKSLKIAILDRLRNDFNQEIHEDRLSITSGATHAIDITLRSILYPNDEVLVLSPQWLFAVGLIRAARGKEVEVPVFEKLCEEREFDFSELIESYITKKTKANYFNSPNNPTGISLTRSELETIVNIAKKHQLWIISDNAYENYDYTERGFIDISQLSGA